MQYTPQNSTELLAKAQEIAGLSLAEIAKMVNMRVPIDLKRDKGWVGILIERALGAKAKSKAEQDFAHLGIELKTIPVSAKGAPLETTFVSLAPLTKTSGVSWQTSHVKHKLQKVLWIPVEGERNIPLANRRVGAPILWSPSIEQEQLLQKDWEELMDMIVLGKVQSITAKSGTVLQLRPKASNSKVKVIAVGENGQDILVNPRGFYLRKEFTAQIINNFLNTITQS